LGLGYFLTFGLKDPVVLQLEITPAGAQVNLPELDEPYQSGMALPQGPLLIKVQNDGYVSQTTTFQLSPENTRLSIVLKAKLLSLTITVEPPDAQIKLLNVDKAYQKGLLLAAGDYQVALSREGFEPQQVSVYLSLEQQQFSFTLTPAKYTLTVDTLPKGAKVKLLDSELTYQAGMVLPPGSYRIAVSLAGFQSKNQTLQLSQDQQKWLVNLTKNRFALTVKTVPLDAKITLSDQDKKTYPLDKKLLAGLYQITVDHPDYQQHIQWLEFSKDQTLHIALKKPMAVKPPSPQPGDVIRDKLVDGSMGPEMIVIPLGQFLLGSVSQNARPDEGPLLQVTINQTMAFAKYETTFEDYDKFTTATNRRSVNDDGWGRARRPVINVSQKDALSYARWLSEQTGQTYRLPTEAQWEYAGRAGVTTDYVSGNNGPDICQYGNIADQSVKTQFPDWAFTNCNDGFATTAEVGSFAANAFGLHDMQGNVWEWVADCYTDNYQSTPPDGSALKISGCYDVVARGGSWHYLVKAARFSRRHFNVAKFKGNGWGFRLIRQIK
ncbi:MAG: SUMF1/EgtB/PvdO family nonheme iron enzyme, partial [Algicola sp.]|nr:SUMF1/EgtB/PvdO family nonheme iron enzyme [Algicola sp.]